MNNILTNIIKNALSKLKPQHGVSLIEILVAITITAIISTAAIEVYITQHQNYIWQEQITEMNMNANAAMEELVKRLGQAGSGIPTGITGTIRYIYSCNTNPDAIRIVSWDLGDSGYFGYEAYSGSGTATIFNCNAANDTGGPYINIGRYMDIGVGDSGIVADYANNYCTTFVVTAVHRITTTEITHSTTRPVSLNSYIAKIEYYRFFLDVDSTFSGGECEWIGDGHGHGQWTGCTDTAVTSNLVRTTVSDPETVIVASNITDLEFMYFMTNGDSSTTASTTIPVDRVRITLTARTEKKVQGDTYRYITLSESVEIRGGRSYRDAES